MQLPGTGSIVMIDTVTTLVAGTLARAAALDSLVPIVHIVIQGQYLLLLLSI